MNSGNILVINAGSSSIKFAIFAATRRSATLRLLSRGQIQSIGSQKATFQVKNANERILVDRDISPQNTKIVLHEQALKTILHWLEEQKFQQPLIGIGHRIVHGGCQYHKPQQISDRVYQDLEALISLAPLHQPHNLNAVKILANLKPDIAQIACFDTGFHHTQADITRMFALPEKYWDAGIRRYGFHGLSYEYISSVLPEYLGENADGRIVIAHLGNGASMCAIHQRKSVATTMGFTALEGLPMGTRCGTLDPGVILFLLEEQKMRPEEITDLLYHHSGLKGVSGLSNDTRKLLASDSPDASKAIDLFVYRINRELGSLTASLGGLDALVFTAGIGTKAVPIRKKVCHQAKWSGITFDETANQQNKRLISAEDSQVSVWVIPTNEELMIARHTYSLTKDTIKHE